MARTSDIPSGLIPEKEIDRALEMRAALGLPFNFGNIKVKPVTLGALSLLELAVVRVFQTADWSDLHGMAMMIWIINNRRDAAELVLDYREYLENTPGAERFVVDIEQYNEGGEDYLREKLKSAHKLDWLVNEFALSENLYSVENYTSKNCLALFNYIYCSFNGNEMLPGAKNKKQAWLFDAPSLASGIHNACSTLNIDYQAAIWEAPACIIFHAHTAQEQARGVEHISRPPNIEFLKEYSSRTVIKELSGKLNLWQLKEPLYYELSEMQVAKGGNDLVLKYNRLKAKFSKMTKEQKTAHLAKYNTLINKERKAVLKKIKGKANA